MDCLRLREFLILTSFVLSILNCIDGGSIENVNIDVTTPCENVAEAISRLYRSLPDQMPLQARCKRYAVFLSMADAGGSTFQLALLQLSGLQERFLDLLYKEITTADLAARYMTVIDTYRTTHLEPAFIDLIECLSEIHTPSAETYLDNPELIVIVELYKRALVLPADEINLGLIDLSAFDPEFRTTLKNLFERHSDTFRQTLHQSRHRIDLFNQLSSSYLSQKLLAEQFIKDTEERLGDESRKRERQSRFRKRNLALIREKDRIRKRLQRERDRQERQMIGDVGRHKRYDEIKGGSFSMRLERERHLNRERQRRFRQRHAERLRHEQEERRLRWRQLRLQNQMLYASSNEVPALELRLGLEQQQQNTSGQVPLDDRPQSTLRPTMGQQIDPNEVESDLQVLKLKRWLGGLGKFERAAYLKRERQKRYRATPSVLIRERERQRRLRQERRRKRQQGNPDEAPELAILEEPQSEQIPPDDPSSSRR